MRAIIGLVMAGFGRYRTRRRNLTIVLSLVFFLLFLFMNFFQVLGGNLNTYWVESYNSGDLAVSKSERQVDLMSPVNPDNYFRSADFYLVNPNLQNNSSPRLRFGAMLGPQKGDEQLNNRLVLIGIDPQTEKNVLPNLQFSEGQGFSDKLDEIILPQAIAGSIGVEIGQEVVVAAVTKSGYFNMERARLVGMQKLPPTAFVFGTYMGYVPLGFAQRLLDTDQVSEVVIKSGTTGLGNTVKGAFRMNPAINNLSASRAISMAYVFLQLIIIVFLGVFSIGIVYQNIVMMNEERVAEIGVYLSYGARPAWIQMLLFGELAVYTLYCCLIGGLVGLFVMGGLTLLGLYPVDMVTDVMMGGRALNLWPQPVVWFETIGLLLPCVLGAAAIPVLRATQASAVVRLFRK